MGTVKDNLIERIEILEDENKNLKNVLNVCREVFQELYNTTEHFNILYKQLDKLLKEK
jgi:uncharacterized protein (UPF0335 family)